MSFSALILAGSRAGEQGAEIFGGAAHKALIVIDGQSLLERVFAALKQAGATRILISCDEGPVAECARLLGGEIIAPRSGPSGSVLAGFEYAGPPLLVTTADHALLRADWVREIIGQTPASADIGIMLAKREAVEMALPGSKRTYLRFADGHWSGCNLFYLRRANAQAAIALWQQIEADRKRPLRIVRRLGLGTLLSYLIGRLTLQQGLTTLGARVAVVPAVIAASNGLAAVDVDTPQDLADVKALLAQVKGQDRSIARGAASK
ncbi:nucleotidyltransferase family protein [Pontixanthobacter sp.]|uniref:nucleotidyltransferase family protein n=1 Tax=Pontixanthobacter sp. TaxID=2792078 RepID=UPI003C7C8B9E